MPRIIYHSPSFTINTIHKYVVREKFPSPQLDHGTTIIIRVAAAKEADTDKQECDVHEKRRKVQWRKMPGLV